MEKLFYYLVFGFVAITFVKVFIFWCMQKISQEPKKVKDNTLVRKEASKVSLMFNQLLKANLLTREDILIIRNILKKYSTNKKYNNDCHLIYSVLKHGNVRMNELGSIEVFLESKRCKSKC